MRDTQSERCGGRCLGDEGFGRGRSSQLFEDTAHPFNAALDFARRAILKQTLARGQTLPTSAVSASKAALHNLTRTLASELIGRNSPSVFH